MNSTRPPVSQVETDSAEEMLMGNLLFGLISVILFCVCCHFFIKSVVKAQPALQTSSYNKAALRLQRGYQVFALGTMTMMFLIGLVVSFYQVYVLI